MSRRGNPVSAGVLRDVIDHMRKARHYADDVGQGVLDFAVGIDELRRLGLAEIDLRWLCTKGFFRHLVETTTDSATKRTFSNAGSVYFGPRSCFTLTDSGLSFARSIMLRRAKSRVKTVRQRDLSARTTASPVWKADAQELWASGLLVKRVPPRATNQLTVLHCFDEDDWPPRIDDPLPPSESVDPVDRLHNTVKRLNGNQFERLVVFGSDGTGQGISWRWSAQARTRGFMHPWDE